MPLKRNELVARIESLAEESERVYDEPEMGYLLLQVALTASQGKKRGLKRLMSCISEHQAAVIAESCKHIS